MKILKKILSLMLICILFSTTVHAQGETLDTNKDEIYEKVLEAYRKGDKMSEEVVTARKQAAEQLGLEAFLDERAFLSVDYRNEQEIGKDGAIKDPAQKTKRTFGVIMVQNMARLQNGMMLLQEKSYITLREDQGMPEII